MKLSTFLRRSICTLIVFALIALESSFFPCVKVCCSPAKSKAQAAKTADCCCSGSGIQAYFDETTTLTASKIPLNTAKCATEICCLARNLLVMSDSGRNNHFSFLSTGLVPQVKNLWLFRGKSHIVAQCCAKYVGPPLFLRNRAILI